MVARVQIDSSVWWFVARVLLRLSLLVAKQVISCCYVVLGGC